MSQQFYELKYSRKHMFSKFAKGKPRLYTSLPHGSLFVVVGLSPMVRLWDVGF